MKQKTFKSKIESFCKIDVECAGVKTQLTLKSDEMPKFRLFLTKLEKKTTRCKK